MGPYAVLGVDLFASDIEIARAFRRLALLHHPVRNGGTSASAARFREVKAAYDVLRGRPRTPSSPPPVADSAPWTSRDLDRGSVERVRVRIARVNDAICAVLADPSPANLDALIDAARWARLDVDSALALKGHVADLRDAHWATLRYADRRAALATLKAFVEAPSRASDLTAMRNLRARLAGLLTVARGLASDIARA